ncbi:MAG: hypothetical protein CMJ49_10090 [Planctomycetaceae bacterium]|nr:hypothetical protein [Planctomycetaceae bacterium]
MSVGDILKLEFLKTTSDGDFVVSSLTITAEPAVVPIPAALWSALPLGLAVVSRGRRHGRA